MLTYSICRSNNSILNSLDQFFVAPLPLENLSSKGRYKSRLKAVQTKFTFFDKLKIHTSMWSFRSFCTDSSIAELVFDASYVKIINIKTSMIYSSTSFFTQPKLVWVGTYLWTSQTLYLWLGSNIRHFVRENRCSFIMRNAHVLTTTFYSHR